jgi:Spy/CpxP family protein refolding chaperone
MKMKIIIAVLLTTVIGLIAQPPMDMNNNKEMTKKMFREEKRSESMEKMHQRGPKIPNLTDEQKTRMEQLKLDLMKAIKPLMNKIGEKEAQLQTLRTEDKPDMNKIFALVDEVGLLKSQVRKEHEKHLQSIRQTLDEKQRIIFDTKSGRHMKKGGHRMGEF